MIIDSMNEKMNTSSLSQQLTNNDFTVMFLRDQLNFLSDKISKATSEIEEKERLI